MERLKVNIPVLVGPTASGKTSLGVALAKAFNGEIISADSMQIYKYMTIGTAKATKEEMEDIPHHLIDFVYPDEDFSVAVFKKLASEKIALILEKEKKPLIVGGTGLYINSMTLPWSFENKSGNEEVRWRLAAEADVLGGEYLHQRLTEVDPISAKKIHPHNINRLIRALEIYEATGQAKSYFDEQSKKEEVPYDYTLIGLDWPREFLYQRINKRVDQMVENGLLEETKMLLDHGYNWDLSSMKAIGYKELRPYLENQQSLDQAIEKLKKDSRHFAKRQMTWFRKDKRIHWIEMNPEKSFEDVLEESLQLLKFDPQMIKVNC